MYNYWERVTLSETLRIEKFLNGHLFLKRVLKNTPGKNVHYVFKETEEEGEYDGIHTEVSGAYKVFSSERWNF